MVLTQTGQTEMRCRALIYTRVAKDLREELNTAFDSNVQFNSLNSVEFNSARYQYSQ